jgi:hypothetical protein
MQDYLLLFHATSLDEAGLSAEEMQRIMMKWSNWTNGMRDQGVFQGGDPLEDEARTVQPDRTVRDGPFAETKEMIAGYIMERVASIDDAVEHARGCPILDGGGYVEVRPLKEIVLPAPDGGTISPCPQ